MKQTPNISKLDELNTGVVKNQLNPSMQKVITDNESRGRNPLSDNSLFSVSNRPKESKKLKNLIPSSHLNKTSTSNIHDENINININNNNYNLNDINNNINTHESIIDENYLNDINKALFNAPILNIEILNSLTLPKGLIIKVNPLGMTQNSLRSAMDGHVYFGFQNEDEEDPNLKVDFLVKPKDDNKLEKRHFGRHFRIKFNPFEMIYTIKDLGFGFGTFMKIIEETPIKDNFLINIGNSYIVCTFGVEDLDLDGENFENADQILNIKVFSGNSQNDLYFFNPSQVRKLYIGRDIGCDIIVDDSLLSRIHCTMEFKDDIGWTVRDGKVGEDITQYKVSTNGTWLYLIEETEIFNDMIFKSNQNVYQCRLQK